MDTDTKDLNLLKLNVTGKKGIITKLKEEAANSRNKKLNKTEEDSNRVTNLILEHDGMREIISSQKLIERSSLQAKYLKRIHRQIKISVIRQGFISNSALAKFRFNPVELIEKITYRNGLEEFVSKNYTGRQNTIIYNEVIESAKKGERLDRMPVSQESIDLRSVIENMKGVSTPVEIGAKRLELVELITSEMTVFNNKRGQIENICYYIINDPVNPTLRVIDRNRLLSLSTTNLEKLVSFYCKIMNTYNAKGIAAKRKADKNLVLKGKYMPKKQLSSSEKQILVKDLKNKGKTQLEIAKQIGCSERTVRKYWNL